ncbi:thiamine pyrophosphate-binding protein [Celeribacter marinus]|uniref:Acetolactate synthase large subunit n=1 Tax=Celeribacter marinus TaxID=1397108 RepID=A0A0N7HI47_9RHOB|nr:thiamine pyrophosphate-binding protein [Celeribacter marinus]ALI54213.1 acetolactate synthase large subunit [Celeribacter marinus]SFK31875.1 acetolactate synthase-1/2/3 large subunit [Celeribacter marinus]
MVAKNIEAGKDLIANQLCRYLEERGTKHVFGLCGHTNIAILSAMADSGLEFVNVRHEQISSHAADGYARVTGKASVVLSHLSPGLTNAATGVANAALDCIPMVVIAGDIPSYYYGKHPHQEVNLHADGAQYEIYRPFVKRAWRVDTPELLPEIMEKAFQLAESGQPGPVLVNVPMDYFSAQIDNALWDKQSANTKALKKPSIDDETAREIIGTLLSATNPVIYAGGGVALSRAWDELKELVDHLSLPVSHSLMGKGCVPDTHPLVLGMTGFWGTTLTNKTTLKADWILGLGTRFKEADCSSWYPEYTFNIADGASKLIHIDIEPQEIGRNYPVEIGAVADLKSALKVLVRVAKDMAPNGIKRPEVIEEIAQFRAAFKAANTEMQTSDAFPMMPERILADLRLAMPDDAILTSDVGWNKNGVAQQFDILTPGSILIPGGFATMGFGPSAAIGAKIAAPERVVISLVGDGGFGQNPAVLATAAAEGLAVIWVVMNNNAFGTIAGLQKAHYNMTYGTTFAKANDVMEQTPDYAAIARAYGCDGVRPASAAAFKPALEAAIASGRPTVIDVAMINNPTPTTGHWNILDIYSPEGGVGHVSTA